MYTSIPLVDPKADPIARGLDAGTHTSAVPRSRILIIDGDSGTGTLLTDFLTMAGLSVLRTESVAEACELMEREPVKLAVIDIDLEGGDSLLESLRESSPDVLTVALTESNDVERAVSTMRRGAFDYIRKPFKVGQVVEMIERGLAQQAVRTQNFQMKSALALYGLADRLPDFNEVEAALQLLATTARDQTGADSINVVMAKADVQMPNAAAGAQMRLQLADLTEAARSTQQGILAEGIEVFRYLHTSDRTETLSSVVITPLVSRKRPMGWLVAARRQGRGFSEGDRKLLTILSDRAAMAVDNGQLFETLERSFRSTIGTLIAALEEKDDYTAGHSERVAEFSGMIARSMGMDEAQCELVSQAGRLHDIGKLAIRTEDLNKPGPLTDEEYERMKLHTVTGRDLLAPIPFFQEIIPAVASHHEKINGTGYPQGLAGDEIPLIARIVAVADAFDAMTSDRAYRPAMKIVDALAELQRCAGTHFDTEVVDAFIDAMNTSD